jgi:hypothetical protein
MKPNLWLLAGALTLQAVGAAAAAGPAGAPRPERMAARPAQIVPKPAQLVPGDSTCAPSADGIPCEAPRPPAGARDTACSGIDVGSTPERSVSRPPTFSAGDILDVNFTVRLQSGRPVPPALVLKVYTPNGHLYQETTFPVAAPGFAPRARAVAGRHFAMKEAPVISGPGPATVAAPPLPVAGTLISQSSLYGSWRVTAGAANSSKVCSARFTVEP